MANFQPVPDILVWKFTQRFLHSPQQRTARFASRVKTEELDGANKFQDIFPQVDGIDYDPEANNLRQGNSPMLEFNTTRIGYRKRAHIWGHAIATEDFHRVQSAYQSQIADLAAGSFARWKDRVLLTEGADGTRLTSGTSGAFNSLTSEALPEASRYAIINETSSDAAPIFEFLDLKTLRYANLYFKNREISDSMGMSKMNLCVASPTQIQNLLEDNNITSSDYNTVRALVKGDVNSYMGHEFIHSKAGQTVGNASSLYFRKNTRAPKITATTGYGKLPTSSTAERIVFCHPTMALTMGMLPKADYMNVWRNPNRMGTWEYLQKAVIGYKRCQNEYMLVAYAKSAEDAGIAIRTTPDQSETYWANYSDSGGNWTYASTQA